jgi:predicted metalloprotease
MSTGTVSPETFTHGSSAQREAWFRRGLESGRIESCQT